MRIMWVTNIMLPQIAETLGVNSVPVGGWMVKLANELSLRENIELCVMFSHSKEIHGETQHFKFMGFSLKNICTGSENIKKNIELFKPDVIHIWGTEYVHSNIVTEICNDIGLADKVVVSIQGLMSVYAMHYTAFLNEKVIRGITLRDLVKGNVAKIKCAFSERGKYEIKTLQSVKHIIGRTDWDKANVELINPDAEYHFNNEMLRDAFYCAKWDITSCIKYSIFFSQATSPIKGLHLMLEALALIKNKYPDVHLYVAGKSFYKKSVYKLSYYEKYILKMIKTKGLYNSITFTGYLDEVQMRDQYLKANVFVSASSIENSPNSVCEAMLLGVPVVSSMVGGVANLMEHGRSGYYYQADAPYMLAYYVKKIFSSDILSVKMSGEEKKIAQERHDPKVILGELCNIYNDIVN